MAVANFTKENARLAGNPIIIASAVQHNQAIAFVTSTLVACNTDICNLLASKSVSQPEYRQNRRPILPYAPRLRRSAFADVSVAHMCHVHSRLFLVVKRASTLVIDTSGTNDAVHVPG